MQVEFFLKTLTLEDVPNQGTIHFVCNSWVYNSKLYKSPRIFFSNKVSGSGKKQSKLRNAETNSNTTTPTVASSSPPPDPSLPPPPPTLTLTPIPNSQYHRLLNFLKTHLSPPFTPESLLHFLKSKLHHHPSFSHYDFHVFTWASFVDSFRHTHSTFHWMAQTLALSHRVHHLRVLLDFIASNPCPCSDFIFSCPTPNPSSASPSTLTAKPANWTKLSPRSVPCAG
ncbi:hypothetical protein Ahy_B08g094355 isoform A [Arachis hypogaea]|nr:hypothetical protein Ahy_B08g094355 isoform A [Arachis hypogaea]